MDAQEGRGDEIPESAVPDLRDRWVDGKTLSLMLAFELSFRRYEHRCPRCGERAFHYGALRCCSFGCPENMLELTALN